jgi:hypothetical protein
MLYILVGDLKSSKHDLQLGGNDYVHRTTSSRLNDASPHAVKNRQQSMLDRSASEIGIDNDNGHGETVQRRFSADFSSQTYDRSGATLS